MSLHRLVMAAAVAAAAVVGATLAHAERASHPEIDGVDVEQVAEIAPGTPLRFSVYGTTGAVATLRIEGGWRILALQEGAPGVYEGVYVVGARDAIGANSRATATLQHAGRLARADLDEPLVLAATPLPWAAAAAVTGRAPPSPSATQAGGGTPVPAAVIASPPLPVAAAPAVTVAAATRPLAIAVPAKAIARVPERATCDDCARVESVRLVEAPRGPLGTLPDKFARAVLGDELGEAHTQRMRRLLDTLAGRPAPAAARGSEYEVVLRTSDGRTQVRRYDRPPPFAPGAIVRLGDGRGDGAAAPF
ncbi:MAG: hypothetical protein ACXWUL_03850 [Caldimonas sp.]